MELPRFGGARPSPRVPWRRVEKTWSHIARWQRTPHPVGHLAVLAPEGPCGVAHSSPRIPQSPRSLCIIDGLVDELRGWTPMARIPAPVTVDDVDHAAGSTLHLGHRDRRVALALEELAPTLPRAPMRDPPDRNLPVWPLPTSPQPLMIMKRNCRRLGHQHHLERRPRHGISERELLQSEPPQPVGPRLVAAVAGLHGGAASQEACR